MFPAFLKKWRSPAQSTEAPALDACRAQMRNWQKMLADEHGRLGHDLTELLATYERSLSFFAAHVNDMDAATLQKEYQSLEAIRSVLGNAVRRLEVSTKDDHELRNEWQEWQALVEAATQPLDAAQVQRREMVRSELAVRGKMPFASPSADVARADDAFADPAEDAPRAKISAAIYVSTEPTVFVEEQLDDLDDWHAIYSRDLETSQDHWQERLAEALTLAARDPHYAAAIVAKSRTWHGERKTFKKRAAHNSAL